MIFKFYIKNELQITLHEDGKEDTNYPSLFRQDGTESTTLIAGG